MVATLDTVRRNEIPVWLSDVMPALADAGRGARPARIRSHGGHSNDIHELTFSDGRVLLVKRARHDWIGDCFSAAARAARLVSDGSDIIVPHPLPLSCDPGGMPVQAYWRIELPTLAQLWPALSADARSAALRSLGALVRRLHDIQAPGWGPLYQRNPAQDPGVELERDLRLRLLPAVIAHWPQGVGLLEQLIAAIPAVRPLHANRPALVHDDLHLGNVLCRIRDERVECVGLLDLDDVGGGAAESDIAVFDVLHSPLFEREIPSAVRRHLRTGYGERLDERLIEFHRCAHLANQGFSSGLLEHSEHAAAIAAELKRRLRRLEASPARRSTPHLPQRLGTGSKGHHAAAAGALPRPR
ncbi:MAG TPA: aminoglycoside phosphotransferase family protein [Longimicrobiales bacterium]|nr:aminoglycoside phosphotransferase family protein [Longimicrobiales bacterium]